LPANGCYYLFSRRTLADFRASPVKYAFFKWSARRARSDALRTPAGSASARKRASMRRRAARDASSGSDCAQRAWAAIFALRERSDAPLSNRECGAKMTASNGPPAPEGGSSEGAVIPAAPGSVWMILLSERDANPRPRSGEAHRRSPSDGLSRRDTRS